MESNLKFKYKGYIYLVVADADTTHTLKIESVNLFKVTYVLMVVKFGKYVRSIFFSSESKGCPNCISTFYSFPQGTTIYHRIRSQRPRRISVLHWLQSLAASPAPTQASCHPKMTTKTIYLLRFLFCILALKKQVNGLTMVLISVVK